MIICERCMRENKDDAIYCKYCGSQLQKEAEENITRTFASIIIEDEKGKRALSRKELKNLRKSLNFPMLVVIKGPNSGARYLIDKNIISIGRNINSDVFLDDVTISRNHVKIINDQGLYTIIDLESTNGTYINGSREKEKILKNNDEIQIGRIKMVFLSPL